MSQHTPGPWVADDSNVLVGRHVLAIVNDPDQPSHLTEVSKANARLMAAAPELLQAAKNFLAYASTLLDETDADVKALRAAIAKAQGNAE